MLDDLAAVNLSVSPGRRLGIRRVRTEKGVLVIDWHALRRGVHDDTESCLGLVLDHAAAMRQLRMPDQGVAGPDVKPPGRKAVTVASGHHLILVLDPQVAVH